MRISKKENGGYAHDLLSVANDTYYCVAIGAASGGFEALKELIASLPGTLSAVSFFVAQPIEEEQFNTLAAILPSEIALSIRRARQLETIQPGIIYTIMPGESMELTAEGYIKILPLQATDAGSISDILFQSVAILSGQNSIGIVLSGTGSDGAAGVKFIHQAGGKVLAQTPQTANYNGMPLSAIATACVDEILPVYEMGKALPKIYFQCTANNNKIASKSLHKTEGEAGSIVSIHPTFKEKNSFTLANTNMEAMVKDALFNSYHHTYIVLDNANNIIEVNGDTAMYFNTFNSNCINKNIWQVLKEAFKLEVQTAFTNALAKHQSSARNVKVVVLKGRLIFIKILVQLLGKAGSINSQYVIILEKIETDQLMNTNINVTNKAVTDLALQKLSAQVEQVR
jgi:hypothetical protein